MNLEILPPRTAGAAENMAVDFLLLQRYPNPTAARFRHYDWCGPAFTFGYGQKIAEVRAQLPPGENVDLCRRPTGGGIVDHRDDWTYTLVIPRGHPLEELRAAASYRAVHEAIAQALQDLGVPATTKPADPEAAAAPATLCFERAETHDVIVSGSGAKIAGAAQKRNKHGLLFQGSIARAPAGSDFDWAEFETRLTALLATTLAAPAVHVPWPELNEEEMSALTDQYASPEWIEYR